MKCKCEISSQRTGGVRCYLACILCAASPSASFRPRKGNPWQRRYPCWRLKKTGPTINHFSSSQKQGGNGPKGKRFFFYSVRSIYLALSVCWCVFALVTLRCILGHDAAQRAMLLPVLHSWPNRCGSIKNFPHSKFRDLVALALALTSGFKGGEGEFCCCFMMCTAAQKRRS